LYTQQGSTINTFTYPQKIIALHYDCGLFATFGLFATAVGSELFELSVQQIDESSGALKPMGTPFYMTDLEAISTTYCPLCHLFWVSNSTNLVRVDTEGSVTEPITTYQGDIYYIDDARFIVS
jgi:hypothetical protein